MHSLEILLLLSYVLAISFHKISGIQQQGNGKNVLFIVIDDLRPTIGSYGHPEIITPNIDQLASKAVQFQNAFIQQAFCGPSRTSFLTSRRPDSTRLYDLHSYWRKHAGNYTTLPQLFKESGYHTASFGKVFHPGICSGHTDDFPFSWSQPAYHAPTQKYKNEKTCLGRDGKLHENIVCPVNVTRQPGGSLPDIQIQQAASSFLKEYRQNHKQKPFFLAVGFHKPHIPLKYPKKFRDLYPLSDIKPPKDPNKPAKMPDIAWNPWTDLRRRDDIAALNVSFPFGPMPKEYSLLIRQSYYAAVSYMDDLVGRVLSSLDQYGFSNNTVISLIGDHGWSLGEHQEWCKYSNFEVATRVPLLVSVPGLTSQAPSYPYINALRTEGPIKHGQTVRGNEAVNSSVPYKSSNEKNKVTRRSESLVEAVDLFPTLAELAGLAPPPQCPIPSNHIELCTEGFSFVKVIKAAVKKETIQWKNAVFHQYPRPSLLPQNNSDSPRLKDIRYMGYSIRTMRYRFTKWIEFDNKHFVGNWSSQVGSELYDHMVDPLENENKALDVSYDRVKRTLDQALQSGWKNALPIQ